MDTDAICKEALSIIVSHGRLKRRLYDLTSEVMPDMTEDEREELLAEMDTNALANLIIMKACEGRKDNVLKPQPGQWQPISTAPMYDKILLCRASDLCSLLCLSASSMKALAQGTPRIGQGFPICQKNSHPTNPPPLQ